MTGASGGGDPSLDREADDVVLVGAGEPLGHLGPQVWLDWPETRAVVAALSQGAEPPRFVGGCVRDALAKRPVADIDLATPLPPEAVMNRLSGAGIKALPTGLKHGTVTAVIGGRFFEITTLRRDLKTDGRHAEVAFGNDWLEDARRRDFTINALSATADGAVFDPFDGLGDLAAGRIRFIGRAEDRIREDHLRILRFFRFFAHLGRPPADEAALDACRRLAPEVMTLSAERIRAEVLKLLAAPFPADAVALMQGYGVMAPVLPEARRTGRLRTLCWAETGAFRLEGIKPDPLRRLAALLEGGEAVFQAVAARLKLSRSETERLVALHDGETGLDPEQAAGLPAALYDQGAERLRDRFLLAFAAERAAGLGGAARGMAWSQALLACETWKRPTFPLRGGDAQALGIAPGPTMGALLRRVEGWWVEGGFQATGDECRAELARVASSSA
ncbi:MAG: CCA tRNA nucleotidyltransferase [Rhodospirillales bacterium]